MKTLDATQRRALRAKAHHLHPVVSVGTQGLTPAVLHEIDVNLLAHELVKLRVHSDDREEREKLLERVCNELDAAPVQHLGKVLIIYRERAAGDEEREAPPQKIRTAPPRRRMPRKPEPQSRRDSRRPPSATAAKKTARGNPAGKRGTRAPAAPRDQRAPEGKHPPRARRRRG